MRDVIRRTVILAVALHTPGWGQPAEPKARVEGRVTNTAGKPLSQATIALVGNNRTAAAPLPPAYRVTSDSDGVFTFNDVEPNAYRLFVQRPGYLDFVYIQPDGKVSFSIADGERKKIDLKMTAPSFLSGKVTNEEGEPFPDARVTAFRVTRTGAKKHLTALSPVAAGPDGSFSAGRLTAGRYYLAASGPPGLTETNQREMHPGKAADERYVTTYYGAAIDASAATLIDVPAETDLHNLDIRLRRAHVFHISGKIVQPSGGPVSNPTVTLLRPDVTDSTDPMGNANRIFVSDGAFQVNGLLPGAYALRGWSGANRQMQGHQSVVVSDHDLENVVLTLGPTLEIPLSVRIEDADPLQAQTIAKSLGRFTLTASDGVNLNAMAQSKDDGTWMFTNIGPGAYRMGLGGPDGTYVKSIRFGERDVTLKELDTSSGGGALVMTLSPHAAEVTGVLNDPTGQPLSGVTVSLWVGGLPPAGTLDQARSTATDAAGKFRFGSLRPGEYRIAAWEKIEPGLANVPEFHAKFDAAATVVRVSADSHEKVQPVVISRQKVDAAAATLQ
jgi:hypothetical protein